MQANDVLASAERYDLTGRLDRQLVTICGIAAVIDHRANDNGSSYGDVLVAQLLEDAARHGVDLALVPEVSATRQIAASS